MKIKRITEEYLTEMALTRSDAIITCMSLGKKFIEHFDKIYKETLKLPVSIEYIPNWVVELSAFFGEVRRIKLKSSKKPLSSTNIEDWFFTRGENLEDFFVGDEADKYKNFCEELLSSNDVKSSIEKTFNLNLD